MIKLVIFDMDGVLVDARELHYQALNEALPDDLKISREDHLLKYDGLSTKTKLEMLGVEACVRGQVWSEKQKVTKSMMRELLSPDKVKGDAFMALGGLYVAVCSNSIRSTVNSALMQIGVFNHVDITFGNDDVVYGKPSTEMYLRAMLHCCVDPCETLIIEDSKVGRQGAVRSGAHVLGVRNPNEVTKERIMREIDEINGLLVNLMS